VVIAGSLGKHPFVAKQKPRHLGEAIDQHIF